MQEIKAYQATNGTVHRTKLECAEHELRYYLRNWLESLQQGESGNHRFYANAIDVIIDSAIEEAPHIARRLEAYAAEVCAEQTTGGAAKTIGAFREPVRPGD